MLSGGRAPSPSARLAREADRVVALPAPQADKRTHNAEAAKPDSLNRKAKAAKRDSLSRKADKAGKRVLARRCPTS